MRTPTALAAMSMAIGLEACGPTKADVYSDTSSERGDTGEISADCATVNGSLSMALAEPQNPVSIDTEITFEAMLISDSAFFYFVDTCPGMDSVMVRDGTTVSTPMVISQEELEDRELEYSGYDASGRMAFHFNYFRELGDQSGPFNVVDNTESLAATGCFKDPQYTQDPDTVTVDIRDCE